LFDPQIRDWVLIPLCWIVFLVNFIRHYATILLKAEPKLVKETVRGANLLRRSQLIRENAVFLPPTVLNERRQLFTHKEQGLLKVAAETAPPAPNPMSMLLDPAQQMNSMKTHLTNSLPHIGMMMLLSTFFTGFVIAKFPFPLSSRFRPMVQRGVDVPNLDVSYVTSLSLYFLFMFGLRGLYSLILGDTTAIDDTAIMQQQQQQMMSATGMGGGPGKPFRDEMEILADFTSGEFALNDIEATVLSTLPAPK